MEELYNQFLEVVKNGDEAAADAFLKEHLTQFPEELQQKIAFAYFKDAVSQEADMLDNVEDVKKRGLDLLKKLDELKKEWQEEAQKA